MFKVGAHVSISGGIWKAVPRIVSMGGNTVQIFTGSPRSWQRPEISTEDEAKFKKLSAEKGVSPVFIHAKYLISLGNKGKKIQRLSIRSLVDDLKVAQRIGAYGVIFHPQGEDFSLLVENIKEVLSKSVSEARLIIENTAHSQLHWVGRIFQQIGSDRLKFCLDTAHIYEAGYDLREKNIFESTMEELQKEIGMEKTKVIHANDSKTSLQSRNDKHQNIGEGELGLKPFAFLLNDKRTKDLPFILETPGFKDQAGGSDKNNIERLKSLVE